jgi:hypothetical protein
VQVEVDSMVLAVALEVTELQQELLEAEQALNRP